MSTELDPQAVKMFGFKVWTYKMGEQVSLMVHLGDTLGLYKTMAGGGVMTSHQVADTAELHERFVREWLLGQAAAGLIDRHEDGSFELTTVQAAVLADEENSINFAAGAFRVDRIEISVQDRCHRTHVPTLARPRQDTCRSNHNLLTSDWGAERTGFGRLGTPILYPGDV